MSEFDKFLEEIKAREVAVGIQIVELQAERDNLRAELKDCVNELCYQCGSYKTAHLGSCDDCRWKAVKEGLR